MRFGTIFCLFAHSLPLDGGGVLKARAMPYVISIIKSVGYILFLAYLSRFRLILVKYLDRDLT